MQAKSPAEHVPPSVSSFYPRPPSFNSKKEPTSRRTRKKLSILLVVPSLVGRTRLAAVVGGSLRNRKPEVRRVSPSFILFKNSFFPHKDGKLIFCGYKFQSDLCKFRLSYISKSHFEGQRESEERLDCMLVYGWVEENVPAPSVSLLQGFSA